MLVVLFEAGGGRHALPTRDLVEVAPWVRARPVAGAPPWVAGYFSYRGAVTPALDVGRLAGGPPCECRWNSRLLMVEVPGHPGRLAALLVERVTTAEISAGGGRAAGEWGPLLLDEAGLFQLIDLKRLLTPERVRGLLAQEG